MFDLQVRETTKRIASVLVERNHYLHRAPPVSFAFALCLNENDGSEVGIVTFGVPASREMQKSACATQPSAVVELNRLWVDGLMPRNVESWFVARALSMLPPRIVVSYADAGVGHTGFIYRALNFRYAGWTDMDRKTPRYDYVVDGAHSRDAFRGGERRWTHRVQRLPKIKYWTTTGNRRDKRDLARICTWPSFDWRELPPPDLSFLLCEG